MGRFRFVHLGVAAALAAASMSVVGLIRQVGATSGTTASSFVPITPCRLFDTRPTYVVGAHGTPVGAGATLTLAVWGTNGNCTIPTGATGLSLNVVAINPTAASYLTVFPSDQPLPLSSSLNWVAGQPPTPNAVTVSTSFDGHISFFNNSGTVDLAADIVGYYVASSAGPAGPPGPPGLAGPKGDTGSAGMQGAASWNLIPSGQTVHGFQDYGLDNGRAATVLYEFSLQLPALAPADFTKVGDNIPGIGSPYYDPTCSGDAVNPTAPAGKVCVYFLTTTNATNVAVGASIYAPRSNFIVTWQAPSLGATHVTFAWAYTAP
jgi:hypothetical protein